MEGTPWRKKLKTLKPRLILLQCPITNSTTRNFLGQPAMEPSALAYPVFRSEELWPQTSPPLLLLKFVFMGFGAFCFICHQLKLWRYTYSHTQTPTQHFSCSQIVSQSVMGNTHIPVSMSWAPTYSVEH